ncbi:glycine oxidase ThiO [Bacillus salacetis]|uniref:glycine oxidase n=1 Tax=Bacillus salacetis TaxID=2315464 RepID=A0A3A1R8T5_9BACI|nr:glycine oxidase ThiO [Bacillus salacetis]RIW38322.1 glycine oxidase ThiO [Bacillus salacetis]
MRNTYDVIVVGGGIIGSSVAFQQAKIGKSVLIIEKNEFGMEASQAAAGMLGAQAEIDKNDALLKLALKSRALFPRLVMELEELTGIQAGLVNKGMLKIAQCPDEVHELKKQVQYHAEWDPEVRWLDMNELLQQEPALSSHLAGAMFIPNDGQVMAPQLSQAFYQGALTQGADSIANCEVEEILSTGTHIRGVQTSQNNYFADTVVIASGAWAGKLLYRSGICMDIIPVKGECFSVIPDEPIIKSTIFSPRGCYAVPKKDGRIIVGATTYPGRVDKSVSLNGISHLSEKVLAFLPELKEATWEKAWAGIRPQTRDGLPYIGAHPEYQGLFIAAGHYRNGILLSPITGQIVSDMIENKLTEEERILYETFKIERQTMTAD